MKVLSKVITVLLILFITYSCNKYEVEEFDAIQDISNEYLYKNDLQKILNPPNLGKGFEMDSPDINKLNLKVYISEELRPINKIKEDNEWMFKNNRMSKDDSIKFFGLVNSKKFNSLEYRTFDKSKINFIKPYHYYDYSNEKLKEDEVFNYITFSKFCFDKDFNYGITVIDYHVSSNGSNFMGYNMSLFIKKVNGKWRIVHPK